MNAADRSATAPLSLQERVRIFNRGTPTPMHVGTSDLVNDLWRANEAMLAALQMVANDPRSGSFPTPIQNAIVAAITAAAGKLPGRVA